MVSPSSPELTKLGSQSGRSTPGVAGVSKGPAVPQTDDVGVLLRALIEETQRLRAEVASIQDARAENLDSFEVVAVTVSTAGTPQQGPDLRVPPGFAVVVKHRTGSGGTMFVANSSPAATNANSRIELTEGTSVSLRVKNMNAVWVNADAAPATAEFLVERRRR